jgi:hypothetical protein
MKTNSRVLVLEVTFRTNDDTRDICEPTEVENLVVYNLNHLKRVPGSDRIDQYKGMNPDCMLWVEGGVFVLHLRA